MGTDSKASFWSTAPGILTGIAAVLTAVTGAYVALHKSGASTARTDSVAPPIGHQPQELAHEPVYIRYGSFPSPHQAELVIAPPPPTLKDTSAFLRLTDASFGTADSARGASPDVFRFELVLTNTTPGPLVLDLAERFFALDDDRGRTATLLYFCCSTHGDLLPVAQSRTLVLYFRSTDWYGKGIQAHVINFRVKGLLPVERATWQVPPLATAD
jgi:hypothetical protein